MTERTLDGTQLFEISDIRLKGLVLVVTLEAANLAFIDRNGAGPGVRLKDPNG